MNYVLFVILWTVLGGVIITKVTMKIQNPKEYGLFKVKNEEICKTCEEYEEHLNGIHDYLMGELPEDADVKTLVKRLIKLCVLLLAGCILWPIVLFSNIVQIIDLHKYNKGS